MFDGRLDLGLYSISGEATARTMSADRTTPDDSTPRRGFGLARFVLRAVSGALAPVRKAAESVLREAEAAKRRRAHRAAKAAAAARRQVVPLERRLWPWPTRSAVRSSPSWRRAGAGCSRRRRCCGRSTATIRYRRPAFTPYHVTERVTRAERTATRRDGMGQDLVLGPSRTPPSTATARSLRRSGTRSAGLPAACGP